MRSKVRAAVLAISVGIGGGFVSLNSMPVLATTPEWYTCPDSSAFELRRDAEADALNARKHQPSADAETSADLAVHARWSTMSYSMYEVYAAGGNRLDALDRRLRPIALHLAHSAHEDRAAAVAA